jgi:hypothetical protein
MKNLKNIFIAMVSILIVACASYMFIPTMGMIITFNTATYFDLAVGACGVLNAIITICVTIAYIAIEFGDDK